MSNLCQKLQAMFKRHENTVEHDYESRRNILVGWGSAYAKTADDFHRDVNLGRGN